jgi:mRNA-degrading endonuclease RelE of RelBE toxin-antitoxin system
MNLRIKTIVNFDKSIKKLAKKYKNIKQDYQKLIKILNNNNHNAIDLGDNFYKIRLQNTSINKGKSSGFRVVYFYKTNNNEIYLLEIYTKNEVQNIDKQKLQEITSKYNL